MTDSSLDKAWGAYGSEYTKTLTTQIPLYFSELVVPQLFDSVDDLRPVRLLDVAAGPGIFELGLYNYAKKTKGWRLPPGSSIVVTDYAEGMVTTAQSSLSSLDLSAWELSALDFKVMDACDPSPVPDQSFTHMVCMFGVMFFPQRAQALQALARKLVPGQGKAVFGSWHEAQFADLGSDFGAFVAPEKVAERPAVLSPLSVCQDPVVFEQEMLQAGFASVSVTQADHVFYLANGEGLLATLVKNPFTRLMFPELCAERFSSWEELQRLWSEFLHSPLGREKWLREDDAGREVVRIFYRANLAFAHV